MCNLIYKSATDIAIIKMVNLNNVPVRNPIKNLVNCAQRIDVRTAIVDGKILIEDGRILNVGEEKQVKDIQKIVEKIWKDTPDNEPEHRTVDDFSLHSFKSWKE
ncbi:MAG: hypothetical protein JSV20_10550 [Candidatus Bathyarchaeota archaeon]|nr:MAG: hypothetical protein JSV20_10550 [Candidatus Bathyarchaeota archaeon]